MIDLIIHDNMDVLVELYKGGDLDLEQLAYPYYASPITKKVNWIHQDELKKMAALQDAYPQANTKKGQK